MFDLDGTLLDTLEDITGCVNVCLDTMGDGPRSREEVRCMVGDGVDVLCALALTRSTPGRIARMKELIKEYYLEQPAVSTAPFDGVAGMLDSLKGSGLKMTILSNRPQAMTTLLVERFFPGGMFDAVVGQRDGIPRKPDPSGAIMITKRMGISPGTVLYTGDSPVDVITGKAAGMHTAAVTWGFRSVEQLRAEHPDFLADNPGELLDFVRKLSDV